MGLIYLQQELNQDLIWSLSLIGAMIVNIKVLFIIDDHQLINVALAVSKMSRKREIPQRIY